MSTVCPENVRHRRPAGARARGAAPAAGGGAGGAGGHGPWRAPPRGVCSGVGPGRGGSVRMCCDSHVNLDCPRQDDDERHDY